MQGCEAWQADSLKPLMYIHRAFGPSSSPLLLTLGLLDFVSLNRPLRLCQLVLFQLPAEVKTLQNACG